MESALPSNTTEGTPLSEENTETLLQTAVCIAEEDGNISCKLPNGRDFYIDGATGQTFAGKSKKNELPAKVAKHPEYKMSRVDSKGTLEIDFSEEVDFESLIDRGPQEQVRSSKRSRG